MASNPASGASTPNPRFNSQSQTAEDLLRTQTVGLVALSDFRKRRAEVIEQKERDAQDALLGGRGTSGTATPSGMSDGYVFAFLTYYAALRRADGVLHRAATPNEPLKKKKRKAV